jgi:hypothetical protein
MGDRVFVELTIPAEQWERVREIIERTDGRSDDECINSPFAHFYFSEVNYGELSCLGKLQDEGIAYDSDWESGSEFGKGSKSCRFNEQGEVQVLEVYDNETGIDPAALEQILVDNISDSKKLRKIDAMVADHVAKTRPWPWKNQEEYGKRYRARKLIGD